MASFNRNNADAILECGRSTPEYVRTSAINFIQNGHCE